MAVLHWTPRHWEDERQRTKIIGAMLISWFCIANTFFQSKHQQKVSWKYPRSHKWHQLDIVIARRSALNNVLATRSYHSADCDTDHAMVCSKVILSPHKLHRSKPTGRTRINVARTADPQRREQFVASLEQSLQDLPD